MSKLEQILKDTMQKVGGLVEKVATTASRSKKAKPQKTGLTDEEGQDFGLLQWDENQMRTLLSASERKELLPLIPNLSAKKALHLTPGNERYAEIMLKRGAQDLVELDVAKTPPSTQTSPPHLYARGSVEHLPFSSDTFDFVLYPSALAWRADLPMLLPELARCLKDSGRVLVSTIHPFFEYLINPRGGFKKNLETVFEIMRENNFFIEDLKEGKLEEALRLVSLPQKSSKQLQSYQGLPVVLVIKALRLRKKKSP